MTACSEGRRRCSFAFLVDVVSLARPGAPVLWAMGSSNICLRDPATWPDLTSARTPVCLEPLSPLRALPPAPVSRDALYAHTRAKQPSPAWTAENLPTLVAAVGQASGIVGSGVQLCFSVAVSALVPSVGPLHLWLTSVIVAKHPGLPHRFHTVQGMRGHRGQGRCESVVSPAQAVCPPLSRSP